MEILQRLEKNTHALDRRFDYLLQKYTSAIDRRFEHLLQKSNAKVISKLGTKLDCLALMLEKAVGGQVCSSDRVEQQIRAICWQLRSSSREQASAKTRVSPCDRTKVGRTLGGRFLARTSENRPLGRRVDHKRQKPDVSSSIIRHRLRSGKVW